MTGFEFSDGSPEEFVERVRGALAEGGLEDYVSVRCRGRELVVGFKWMGTSELRYRLAENEAGFRAELSEEKISPFHSPFKRQFEDRFEKVVGAVGARVV